MPGNHSRADDAEANHGFVTAMMANKNSLEFECELYGHDAPKIAASNSVSIYAEPDWEDTFGKRYQWPIRHVALTPDPRIPGLKRLTIAASNGTKTKAILASRIMPKTFGRPVKINRNARHRLALDGSVGDPGTVGGSTAGDINADGDGDGENGTLDLILSAIEDEYLPRIREASEKREKVALAKEMAGKIDAALRIFEGTTSDGGDEEEREYEPRQAAMGNQSTVSMSNPLHREMVRLSNENRTMRIEGLFDDGKIGPKQKNQLMARYTGEKAVVLALSNQSVGTAFDETMEILNQNVSLTHESTGPQVPGRLVLANPYNDPAAEAKAKAERDADMALCLPSSARARRSKK